MGAGIGHSLGGRGAEGEPVHRPRGRTDLASGGAERRPASLRHGGEGSPSPRGRREQAGGSCRVLGGGVSVSATHGC